MKIYDRHISTWEATVETHEMQLQRCLPCDESRYKAQLEASRIVLASLKLYKELEESLPPHRLSGEPFGG